MSFLSKLLGKEQPVDLNMEANRHLVTALVAHNDASDLEHRQSVAAKHVRQIAVRHATIASRIDDILEAYEGAE